MKSDTPSIHELSEFLSRDKSPQKENTVRRKWVVNSHYCKFLCVFATYEICVIRTSSPNFFWGKKNRSRTPQMTWRWRSLALRPDMRHGCCFKKLGVIGVLSLVKQQKVQTFWDLLAIIFTHGLWLMFCFIQGTGPVGFGRQNVVFTNPKVDTNPFLLSYWGWFFIGCTTWCKKTSWTVQIHTYEWEIAGIYLGQILQVEHRIYHTFEPFFLAHHSIGIWDIRRWWAARINDLSAKHSPHHFELLS